jgi:hypothetical protein
LTIFHAFGSVGDQRSAPCSKSSRHKTGSFGESGACDQSRATPSKTKHNAVVETIRMVNSYKLAADVRSTKIVPLTMPGKRVHILGGLTERLGDRPPTDRERKLIPDQPARPVDLRTEKRWCILPCELWCVLSSLSRRRQTIGSRASIKSPSGSTN